MFKTGWEMDRMQEKGSKGDGVPGAGEVRRWLLAAILLGQMILPRCRIICSPHSLTSRKKLV